MSIHSITFPLEEKNKICIQLSYINGAYPPKYQPKVVNDMFDPSKPYLTSVVLGYNQEFASTYPTINGEPITVRPIAPLKSKMWPGQPFQVKFLHFQGGNLARLMLTPTCRTPKGALIGLHSRKLTAKKNPENRQIGPKRKKIIFQLPPFSAANC